nr:MAG TPA: hypothetical protein [Caudoviricetes sp.]
MKVLEEWLNHAGYRRCYISKCYFVTFLKEEIKRQGEEKRRIV